MPLAGSVPCADLGTEYCPCALAFAGSCVYCTMIQTGETCACRWAGTCVLLHIGASAAVRRRPAGEGALRGLQGSAQGPNGPGCAAPGKAGGKVRRSDRATVLSATTVAPHVRELHLALGPGECARFRRPGAFLILRPASCPTRYDLPLTVVGTGSRSIRLVFRVAGPKSRALSGLVRGDTASWRGPYYNGLMGGHRLVRGDAGRAVVVARGLGQAVAVPICTWLRARGARVSVLLDPRGAGGAFASAELAAVTGESVRSVSCYRPDGLATVRETIGTDPGDKVLLVSCGSDLQHRWIAGAWPRLQRMSAPARIELVASNNSLIVCGEGTCGACTRRLPGGGRIRGCKADVPPERVWLRLQTLQDLRDSAGGSRSFDAAVAARIPVPRGANKDG